MLPDGVEDYEFDGRRFLDAVVNNWVKAFNLEVKKIGVHLDDRQMNALMERLVLRTRLHNPSTQGRRKARPSHRAVWNQTQGRL